MDKDTGQHRTGKSDSGHTGHNIGHIGQLDVLSLWLSTNEILDRLGVSSRTLRRMVKRGEVERRKVGRECRYRARKADTPDTQGGHWTHRTAVTQSGQVAAIALAPENSPTPDASPDLATLTALVQQLTDDLSQANQEKGEAIGIGWMLAEQRDHLTADLAALQRAIYEVADSPLALPVRRRIMQALRQSVH